jgi:hypothetical protein
MGGGTITTTRAELRGGLSGDSLFGRNPGRGGRWTVRIVRGGRA